MYRTSRAACSFFPLTNVRNKIVVFNTRGECQCGKKLVLLGMFLVAETFWMPSMVKYLGEKR